MTKIVDKNYKIGTEILEKIEGKAVFDLLNELNFVSQELSAFIVSFAYGQIFTLPHLDLKTKELLILAMLLAKGNADAQLKVHLKSALNTGNSFQEIEELIELFNDHCRADQLKEFIEFTANLKNQEKFKHPISKNQLNKKNRLLIEIAILASLGNNIEETLYEKIRDALKFTIKKEEINEVMLLLIPYCGFPNSINGTLILKKALVDFPTFNVSK